MDKELDVKILISCHKSIVTPDSDVYLPVHVGAEKAKEPLQGMQPDNQGENISDRNFTFCELTAQYWAWKNLEADYVGLCHYRRYFCFDGKNHVANDHEQIEVDCLSPSTLAEYRINDTRLVEEALRDSDMIVPPYWDVRRAPTPDGYQSSVAAHMMAYGLISQDVLDLLFQIVEERQPAYLHALRSYLNGSRYLGYNCFIMKRDLFDGLCSFEFDVLLEFDKRFDYSNLTTTEKRVCGYLGEILYSVYVGKIVSDRRARVVHFPMVFFRDTSPLYRFEAPEAANPPVRVFWRYFDADPDILSICLRSLFSHIDAGRRYEVSLFHTNEFDYKCVARFLSKSKPDSVKVKHAAWPALDYTAVSSEFDEDELTLFFPILLPWLCPGEDKVLWIYGTVVFREDPAVVLDRMENGDFCSARHIQLERDLNQPVNYDKRAQYRSAADGTELFDPSCMMLDLASIRERIDLKQVAEHCHDALRLFGYEAPKRTNNIKIEGAVPLSLEAMMCHSYVLSKMGVALLPFDAAFPALHEEITERWASEESVKLWKAAGDPSVVLHRRESNPVYCPNIEASTEFWQQARDTFLYERLLARMCNATSPGRVGVMRYAVDKILPQASMRRRVASKLYRVARGK